MADSISLILSFDEEQSDQQHEAFRFPYVLGSRTNEDGEVIAKYSAWEPVISPLTGAKFKVKAISRTASLPHRVTGYEASINVPACLVGRNHFLVNGVYQATKGGLELLRFYGAQRDCTPLGLEQFTLDRVRLTSITLTFLFAFASEDEAAHRLQEFRRHAEGILNHAQTPHQSPLKSNRHPCFVTGTPECFTQYIKTREYIISAYIKQPNVPGAFATFPNAEVEQELVELAQKTVRVEVALHGKWLKAHSLDTPEAWRNNELAYETVFDLVRATLRLDESLNIRTPKEAVIAKLPIDHQTILRAHLAGENVRQHKLLLIGKGTVEQVIDAQNKKFSACKRSCLATGVDLSIPWGIQSGKLSTHLKDWLKYPGEFEPSASLAEHVFSRASAGPAIEALADRIKGLLKNK